MADAESRSTGALVNMTFTFSVKHVVAAVPQPVAIVTINTNFTSALNSSPKLAPVVVGFFS